MLLQRSRYFLSVRYALLRSKMYLNRTAMDEDSRQKLDEEIMGGFTELLRSG